jgi:putative DNA primase/helicase
MSEYVEFLEGKKYPAKSADRSNSHESFKNAGYVITEDEVIVDIDCLDKDVIEKAITFFNIKTQIVWTTRGAHFYFSKPTGFRTSKKVCPLGFEVEYKTSKNSRFVTIKQNGELRKIENEGVREELPEIFFTQRRLESLLGLEDGDGRNNMMFQHRMKISHLKQWKSILRFINNYVLTEPLDEKEFEVISREGVSTDIMSGNELETADYIVKKYRMVMYSGLIYWWNGTDYVSGDELEIERLIFSEFVKKSKFIKEVYRQILYKVPIIPNDKEFDIKFQNGFLRDGEFIEVDYQEFTPYSIPISYYQDAEPVQIVDDYLDHLTDGDESYRLHLLEALSHVFITKKSLKRSLAKFFIFIGSGGNGKSTLFSVIKEIVGKKNCSSLSINQLGDMRFMVSTLGKLVNLGDDIDDEYINQAQCKTLKNISTCDYISFRRLHQQSFDTEITTSLMFTSNHQVKSKEKGDSFKRRVDWLPMFGKPKAKDKNFLEKLTSQEALEYWIKLIIDGYKRLYENQEFTYSEKIEEFNLEYHRVNNNVLEFLEERIDKDFIGRKKRECYKEYKEWAGEIEEFEMSSTKFHETICDYFNIELKKFNVNGKDGRTSVQKYVKRVNE